MADFTPNRPRAYSNPNKRAIRQLLAAEACEPMARRMAAEHPDRFKFHPTTWGKFPDGTDKIIIGGYTPTNELAGEHVVLLCSFHNNDVTWSQFQVMIVLLQSFIESLTVVLPFYPVGTMERVVTEGEVATANTYAQMFSTLPSCGRPTRLMTYDIHTLQNRFYLSGATLAVAPHDDPVLAAAARPGRRRRRRVPRRRRREALQAHVRRRPLRHHRLRQGAGRRQARRHGAGRRRHGPARHRRRLLGADGRHAVRVRREAARAGGRERVGLRGPRRLPARRLEAVRPGRRPRRLRSST